MSSIRKYTRNYNKYLFYKVKEQNKTDTAAALAAAAQKPRLTVIKSKNHPSLLLTDRGAVSRGPSPDVSQVAKVLEKRTSRAFSASNMKEVIEHFHKQFGAAEDQPEQDPGPAKLLITTEERTLWRCSNNATKELAAA